MRIQDLVEAFDPPLYDEKGIHVRAVDKAPGYKRRQEDRVNQHLSNQENFEQFFIASIVDPAAALGEQHPVKHDAKIAKRAAGRWTMFVPAEDGHTVQQALVDIITKATGDVSPSSTNGGQTTMNAWPTLDFHMNFNNVAAIVSLQWTDVAERNSKAAHLEHPAFRVFSLDYSFGSGYSTMSDVRHKGL